MRDPGEEVLASSVFMRSLERLWAAPTLENPGCYATSPWLWAAPTLENPGCCYATFPCAVGPLCGAETWVVETGSQGA